MAKLNFLGGKIQAFDDNGAVLSGGKVHFYEPGTTTNKDTYTASDLQTANANPVILDSAGRATIWLANEDYKVVLKDSSDTTIYTEDNINPATTSSTSNFSLQDNSSFEGGVDANGHPLNWVTTEWGTVSIDSTDNGHSENSAKFASTGSGGGFIQSENFIEIDEFRTYSLHWLMKSSAAGVRNLVQIKYYTDAQVSVSTEILYDESTNNSTSWEAREYEANPPSTARYCKLEFYGAHSSDSTPGNVWYDGILFQRKYPVPENLEVVLFDDGAAVGPNVKLFRDSESPADSDVLGKVLFEGRDDGDNRTTYAGVRAEANDVTDTTEDGQLVVSTMQAGTETDIVTIATGVQLGSPTGGDQGAGTLNTAGNIYTNGTQIKNGWVHLSTQTPSAASSADFTSLIDATYDVYIITIDELTTSTAADINLKVSTNNGGAWAGGTDYEYASSGYDTGGTARTFNSTGAAAIQLFNDNASTANYGANGTIYISGHDSGNYTKILGSMCGYRNTAASFAFLTVTGIYKSTTNVDAVQVLPSSGTITGEVRLWGLVNS